tara:strand:+ start:372 stop:644 length:273 start_codon:yes stop_codon:yes gene_type:complete
MVTKILTLTLLAPNRKTPNSNMRWFALVLALMSVMFLASGSVASQWVGWILSFVAAAFWANFARLDKDTPRMLMELFYLIASIWGIFNWI